MTLVPIRSDNAYVGISKQSSQGVPVAPSVFIRWLDGTKFEYDLKNDTVWEGDGTRRLSQLVKKTQSIKCTLQFNPRPGEIGFFETAAMGYNSDTLATATVSTTVSASTLVGASSLTLPSNVGLSGTGTIALVVSAGTANEEIQLFTLPATGSGPYTITLANSATFKNTHSSGDAVRTYSMHTISDSYDSPYYTIEFGLGSLNGGAGPTIRVSDCKVEAIHRSSKAGELLTYKVEFIGIASTSQGSPSTVLYENHSPFLYSQSFGGWTINGSQTGDALAVESFEIDQKNNLDTSIQAEQLTLGALIFGNLDVSIKSEIIMQNSNLIALTYWGSATGTSDSQTIGAGNMTLTLKQPDNFHQVTYTIPTLHYEKVAEPEPKKDGKHFKLGIQAMSVSNQSQNTYLLQVQVQNIQNTTY